MQNIISLTLLGVIGFSAYKIYTTFSSNRIGQNCPFEDGLGGKIVFTFDKRNVKPEYRCRRCNKTGCASYAK